MEYEDGSVSDSYDCGVSGPGTEGRKLDFSLVFGAGVDIGRASIGLRYDLGLRQVQAAELADIKNRTLSLLVGWTFRPAR